MTSNPSIRLAMLSGDGIGPEISAATRLVLEETAKVCDFEIIFKDIAIGLSAMEASGTTFPNDILDNVRDCDGIILGPVSHNDYPPRDEGGLNPSGELRKQLDLFANIRPARSRYGTAPAKGNSFNLVVVRENTEGFYADRNLFSGPGEFMPTEDVAMSLRKISRKASIRIAEAAFEEASARKLSGLGAGRVTVVHKANVLRMSDGLFLACTREVAESYPDIDYDERIVDAMCAHLVRRPGDYDVICTTNMFGDILSDLASELAGSLGLAASLNFGNDFAMAQAQHGSAPDIAGRNIANPTSLIGSAAMLLDWIGRRSDADVLRIAAARIEAALDAALAEPGLRTPDLGGSGGTDRFAKAVAERVGCDGDTQ